MCRVETKDTVTECFGKKVCEKAYRDGEMIFVFTERVCRDRMNLIPTLTMKSLTDLLNISW